jgi:hypothetical protein
MTATAMVPHKVPGGRSPRAMYDWSLLYLFSYDFELGFDRELIGDIPSGVRMNLFARSGQSTVYHVARNASIAGGGMRAITGRMEWGGDQLLLRDDDVAIANIRLTIRTDDHATLHMSYSSIAPLGPGGTRRIVSATGRDRLGKESAPVNAPVVISPRFQTSATRYSWLNEHQGVGFGHVQIINSKFRRTTIDVYVLT